MRSPRVECTRFHADGTRCTRRTRRQDRWCGHCDGFTGPYTPAPSTEARRPPGTPRYRTLPPLDLEDALDMTITVTAVRYYTAAHGCRPMVAAAELRSMLEDFAQLGVEVTEVEGKPTASLFYRGYTLLITPDYTALVGYDSRHRERTWGQLRARVPSRLRRSPSGRGPQDGKKGGALAEAYPPIGHVVDLRPALPDPHAVRSLAVQQIHVPAWAVYRFAVLWMPDWRPGTDEPALLHARIVEDLAAALRSAAVCWQEPDDGRTQGRGLALKRPGRTWVLREDGRRVIALRDTATPDPAVHVEPPPAPPAVPPGARPGPPPRRPTPAAAQSPS